MANPTNSTPMNPSYVSPTDGRMNDSHLYSSTEPMHMHHEALCWKSIFAGSVVSILTYSLLMALGLAVGGANLQGVINGPDTMRGLGMGTVAWVVVSLIASLAVGAYTAGRSRRTESMQMGRVQGLVVAGIFFMFVLAQFGSAVATVGKGAGATVGAAGQAAGAVAMDPRTNEMAEDVLGDTNTLKSPPEVVARGLTRRLVRGDTESATAYLAYQTGQSKEEARAKVTKLEADAKNAATQAGIAAAEALKFTGWTLFASILLGSIAAFFMGGMGGAKIRENYTTVRTNRGIA